MDEKNNPGLPVSYQAKRNALVACALMIIVAIIGVFGARKLQTKYSVMQFLPDHHPAIQMDKKVRGYFHIKDLPTFVGLVTLKPNQNGTWLQKHRMTQLTALTNKIQTAAGVYRVLSLSNVNAAAQKRGVLSVGPLIQVTPQKKWQQRISGDPLLVPMLISKHYRTILIYVQLKNANVHLLANFYSTFRKDLKQGFQHEQTSVGGVPAVQTELGLLLSKELRNFIALTILACAITLILIFSTISTMLIPMIFTAFANVMVFAVMAWLKQPFTVLSSTIPILIFITVVSLSVHFILRFIEDAKNHDPSTSRWSVIREVNKEIWLPNLLGALTTCIGFLTLLWADVPLIRSYGVEVAGAVMLSWLLTTVGIIPLLLLLPSPVARNWVRRPASWTTWIMSRAKIIGSLVVILCILLVTTSRHLYWTAKLFDDLPKGQPARVSTERIDKTLGGVIPLDVAIISKKKSAWTDPAKLQTLKALLVNLRRTNGVGTAHGIPDFFHALAEIPKPILPVSRAAVSEIYFLYSMSDPDPLDSYLSSNQRITRIGMRIRDLPSDSAKALVKNLKNKVQKYFPHDTVEMGGMGAIVHLIQDEISLELIYGFWQALILIVIILAFIFRSFRTALLAALPNLVPPIFLLGYLSLTRTAIEPGVAIIFSIALGLAFNNTVYLLNRLRAFKNSDGVIERDQLVRAFRLEGNPCLVSTAIVLIGFSVFLFSYFSANQIFGRCMIISLSGGIVGDLFFLPAMLYLWPAKLRI